MEQYGGWLVDYLLTHGFQLATNFVEMQMYYRLTPGRRNLSEASDMPLLPYSHAVDHEKLSLVKRS